MSVWDPFRLSRSFGDWDDMGIMDWNENEMDMYEEGDNVVIKLKAPGFDEKNVEITMDDRSVTITGKIESEEKEEDKAKKYYRKEIKSQSFTRSINLPSKIDSSKAQAKFKGGILTLTLPKADEAKPKKLTITPE